MNVRNAAEKVNRGKTFTIVVDEGPTLDNW